MSVFFPLCIIYIFQASICAESASKGHIGTTLTAGHGPQTWLTSPNGTFSVGFIPAPNSEYNFGIWYNKIPQSTSAWRATNNDTAVAVQGNDTFLFQDDGRLLLNSNMAGIIWGTSTTRVGVAYAALMEDGQLVLLSSTGTILWTSFEHPTDTLLPGQHLAMDISRVALFYEGYWLEPYWRIQHDDTSSQSHTPLLNFSSTGVLMFFDGNGTSWKNPIVLYDTAQRYALDYPALLTRRLKLDDDGNLRIYSLLPNGTAWAITWQAVLLECDIFGKCGRFGICTYRPNATCTCPPGFHPTNASDPTQDCAYDTPLPKCPAGSNFTAPNSTRAVRLVRTDYSYNDYNSHPLPSPTSEAGCLETCMRSCQCLGAAYQIAGSGICWLKGLDPSGLFNGKQSLELQNVFFLKVSARDPGFQWLPRKELKLFKDPVRAGLLSTVIVLSLMLLGIVCYSFWLNKINALKDDFEFDGCITKFSYQQLQAITNNFREKLGSGGFGTVYKGTLPDQNETLVAVKEIDMDMQADKQFQAEVKTIGKIHHINLVRLLGYCYEGNRKLLVYEYMPNGSLEKLLFAEDSIEHSNSYLHDQCHECILHCDIKPQNILLDADFVPKVADFGLAKLAPEWISNLPITTKVDVYSFGMVLLEIISGRDKYRTTPSAFNSETDRWCFPDWAYKQYQAEDVECLADSKLVGNIDWLQLNRLLKIAFWCIQYDAAARPPMHKVVQMMENNVEVPDPPFPKLHKFIDDVADLTSVLEVESSIKLSSYF